MERQKTPESTELISDAIKEIKDLPSEEIDRGSEILKTGGFQTYSDGGNRGPRFFIDTDGKLKQQSPNIDIDTHKHEPDTVEEVKKEELQLRLALGIDRGKRRLEELQREQERINREIQDLKEDEKNKKCILAAVERDIK